MVVAILGFFFDCICIYVRLAFQLLLYVIILHPTSISVADYKLVRTDVILSVIHNLNLEYGIDDNLAANHR